MEAIVKIKDLSFYRGRKKIFDGITLEISQGKIVAVMGTSGSGKTTLLRLISGELAVSCGKIILFGQSLTAIKQAALYRLRRRMGVLFQSGALFTNLTVAENVAFPVREQTELPEELIKLMVTVQLEAVGLRGAEELMPSRLSGGMARRVALARALILNPELMLYDEPFVGQDPINKGILLRLIRQLNDALNLTSVIISHDVAEVFQIADYIYILADGKIIGEGTPQELQRDASPHILQFIQGLSDGAVPFRYLAAHTYAEDLGL